MLLALLLVACPPGPGPGPAERPFADPAETGPWAVGVTTRQIVDGRGKALTLEIWYPARIEDGAEPDPYEPLPLVLDAHRDARPAHDHTPWPLVAFSHGFGGIRWQSAFLTEHLASHGYVVVAPDHPRNTLYDLDEEAIVQVAVERPGDVISAVDYVLAAASAPPDPLWRMVSGDAYGMVGHSFGAFTSLVVGGGVLDASYAPTWCAERDPAGCAFFEDLEVGAVDAAVPDPRAVTTVPIAPGGWYAFGPDGQGLQTVREPLVVAGDADSDLPYDEEGRPTWEALDSPRTLMTLHGAGHWGFTDLCRFVPGLLDCSGATGGFMEPERVREVTRTTVTAWLAVHLLDDTRYAPWIDADAVTGADVTWETE